MLLVVSFAQVIFFGGLAVSSFKQGEVFPLFSWALFSLTPSEVFQCYTVEIRALEGQTLAAPVVFAQAGKYLEEPHSITAFFMMQRLGARHAQGHEVQEEFRHFADQFLPPAGTFALVRLTGPTLPWSRGETEPKKETVAIYHLPDVP